MEKVILLGKKREIEVYKDSQWIDGQLQESDKHVTITGVVNPMSYKTLKLYEPGKYTEMDVMIYSKDYVDITSGVYCYIPDKRGKKHKYQLDSIKEWDDCDLIKYIGKRVDDEQ